MSAPVDPARCPLCGAANQCTMAGRAPSAAPLDCWCTPITIPAAVLARLPEQARGCACICAGCATSADVSRSSLEHTSDAGGRPAVRLRRGADEVLIALQGAQILAWRHNGADVLWQASHAEFVAGKAVRGGVPLVFPWFGDHSAPGHPAHGYARNLQWQLAPEDGEEGARFVLHHPGHPGWPHAVFMSLLVQLHDQLHIEWTVHNRDTAAIRFEQALHTYFAVGDVHRASVHGLAGVPVSEHAAAPAASFDRDAPVQFVAETDRIYQGVPDELVLRAAALRREVVLTTANARSAIVWNPWPAKTARLPQMAAEDWRSFVCIESANVRENAVHLAAGAQHSMRLSLAVRELPR